MELLQYGMQRVGAVQIVDGRFEIKLLDQNAGELERCIYAFLVGDEILRVGTSKEN